MTADVSPRRLMLTPSLAVLIGVHLALDVALVGRSWHWSLPMLMAALAIPLSQLALLVIWSAVATTNPLLRFAVPTGGTLACWFMLSLILPWGTGEAASVGWAIALVVQVITSLIAVECYNLCYRLRLAPQTEQVGETRSSARFGISTLMLWTTVLGFSFAFIQFGQRYWQWTAAVFQWNNMSSMPIIGIANGMVGSLWLWVFAARGIAGRIVKIATTLVMTGGLACLQCYLTKWFAGTSVLNLDTSIVVLAAQSIMLCASLVVAEANFR